MVPACAGVTLILAASYLYDLSFNGNQAIHFLPSTTPIESRCPPLSPAFLGVRVPADGMAIAGQAI